MRIRKVSEVIGMRVYTDGGDFFGEVEEANLAENKVDGWRIRLCSGLWAVCTPSDLIGQLALEIQEVCQFRLDLLSLCSHKPQNDSHDACRIQKRAGHYHVIASCPKSAAIGEYLIQSNQNEGRQQRRKDEGVTDIVQFFPATGDG